MRSPLVLLGSIACSSFLLLPVLVAACGQSNSGGGGGGVTDGSTGSATDGSSSTDDGGGASDVDGSGSSGKDGSSGAMDAAFDATGSNKVCSFNKDCPTAERCECDETTGCFCHLGVRGTGKNGIDKCVTGNDCASALCVEGPTNGTFYCSDECMNGAGCTGMLSKCSNIALVGMICVRM